MSRITGLEKGNLVTYKNKGCIIDSHDLAGGRTDLSLRHPTRNDNYEISNSNIEEVKCVWLDKEILELLGFKVIIDDKVRTSFLYKNFKTFFITESHGIFRCGGKCSVQINFVHELQNLLPLLTDEKLDIKSLRDLDFNRRMSNNELVVFEGMLSPELS